MNRDLFNDCIEKMGITLTDKQIDMFETYDRVLKQYNPVIKMVKATGDEFVIRHYADSLVGAARIKEVASGYENPVIADLGSGAGLPGIPLAIALGDLQFTLIERMAKRADFLNIAIRAIGLENVKVEQKRLCEIERKFEVVTCRAFHPFYDIEDEVSDVLAPEGTVVLYKGRRITIEKEFSQVKGAWDFRAERVRVPHLDAERALLVGVRK